MVDAEARSVEPMPFGWRRLRAIHRITVLLTRSELANALASGRDDSQILPRCDDGRSRREFGYRRRPAPMLLTLARLVVT